MLRGTVNGMSKKTSPNAGPSRRPRSRPVSIGNRGDERGGQVSRGTQRKVPDGAPEAVPERTTFIARLRSLLPTVLISNAIVLIAIIIFSLIVLIATSAPMAAMPATVAETWLALNLAPVSGRGISLALLPMLPAIGVVALVSRRVYKTVKDRISLHDLLILLCGTLGVPALITVMACAMLWDASSVFDVASPNVFAAVGVVVLLHACAFMIGMGTRLWRALARRYGVPSWVVDSVLLAVRAVGYLLLAAFIVFLISLAVHYRAFAESLQGYSSAGVAGVMLISLIYLPNAVVASLAVIVGSSLELGQGSVSLFAATLVPTPPVPVFAALPTSMVPSVLVVLILPVVAVSLALRKRVSDFLSAAVITVAAGLGTLLLSFFAGGSLGVYGYVGPLMWLTPLMVMLVIGVVSVAVVALTRYREGRNSTKLLGGEHSVADPAFVTPVAATSIPGQKDEVEDAGEGEESDEEPDGELLETENDQEEDSPEAESDEPYEITANGLDSAEILEEAEIRDAAIDLNESQENLPESGEITAGNDQDNDQGAESAGLQGHNMPEEAGEPEDEESTETEDAPEKEEKGEA
ncbi:DUF6350 family protein [Corynebacterium pseudotuberculosis]|uniref:cell division protein PerM n=1 Tax=Corynebacterium pseudotuberculosis TaxID=1719 RepID=UPI0001DD839D|nr:DUF6350 family protein [Corynebacterium pseudotuberculosis]ADK28438.1 hypothetical protein CPFRC_03240 [Corynebacterium pseudotuberculosis FRC41]ADL20537.2 hypothetical protein CP1002_09895 [Corynebacterium pseudotuberculosis 1002]ALF58344.1 hypothetical protein AN902_09765 [Corynebacterium pseudotuberculosis]ALU20362.1 hypothetical protein AK970_09765 [Corynebacterium pseudotuberculosis]ANK56028.1 Hypothetical protein CpPA02_0617 [Corynebacterium pseudotuberculosis]